MKHQVPESMKFRKLQRRLKVSRAMLVGTLEVLWIATQKNAPQGDIGRHSNEEIAIECDWEGDADKLIDSLVETGWLDVCEVHRRVVHDWQEHCPGWVKRQLTRHRKSFVTASRPQTITHDVIEPTKGSPGVTDDGLEATPNLTKPNQTQPNKRCGDESPRVFSYPEKFEEFWKAYPQNSSGRKRGKKTTYQLWRKLPEADLPDLLKAAKNYAKEQTEFIRDPERFLKNDWWRDWVEVVEKQGSKVRELLRRAE